MKKSGFNRLRPGDIVPVKHSQHAYKLPAGLKPGDKVKLLKFDASYWDVEFGGATFKIFMMCIDVPF